MDKSKNKFGNLLLNFCKGNSMFIVNGRVGNNKNIGRFTCRKINKISVSCRPRVKVPQKSLDLFEKDKYYCCSSLKASLDEYLVYSSDIYTTPTNTG
jgi:hypothetical protein